MIYLKGVLLAKAGAPEQGVNKAKAGFTFPFQNRFRGDELSTTNSFEAA